MIISTTVGKNSLEDRTKSPRQNAEVFKGEKNLSYIECFELFSHLGIKAQKGVAKIELTSLFTPPDR
jgi:hypothetical protein